MPKTPKDIYVTHNQRVAQSEVDIKDNKKKKQKEEVELSKKDLPLFSDEFKQIPDLSECDIEVNEDDKKITILPSCDESRTDDEVMQSCLDIGLI